MNIDEIRSLLMWKADKVDVVNLEKVKAEKIDLKLTDNMNELHQKQMQHMIIIMIEIIKSSWKLWDKSSQTNSNLKYLFRQALTVYSWMKGRVKKGTIDSSFSPRLNEDAIIDDDTINKSIIKLSPFTSKMEIGVK